MQQLPTQTKIATIIRNNSNLTNTMYRRQNIPSADIFLSNNKHNLNINETKQS